MERTRQLVAKALEKRLLFTPHSVEQMNKPDRMITLREVKEALSSGKVIEDYPEDKRGHSCLVMGYTSDRRPLHIVCSPKEDYLAIVTVYAPAVKMWDVTFTKRAR